MLTLRNWPGWLATLTGLILLLWGLRPWSNEARHLEVIMPEATVQKKRPGVSGVSEASSAAVQVDFAWPGRLRAGDSGWIRLHITFPEQDGYSDWWGEARLELPGLVSQPPGEMLVPRVPGKPLDFAWRVQAAQSGLYRGNTWLFLEIRDQAGQLVSRRPLTAQRIEVRVIALGILGGLGARLGGSLCLVAGLIWAGRRLVRGPR